MLWSSFAETAEASAPGREVSDTQEHEAILEALRAGDGEAAEKAVRHHIETACDELLAVIRSKEAM